MRRVPFLILKISLCRKHPLGRPRRPPTKTELITESNGQQNSAYRVTDSDSSMLIEFQRLWKKRARERMIRESYILDLRRGQLEMLHYSENDITEQKTAKPGFH